MCLAQTAGILDTMHRSFSPAVRSRRSVIAWRLRALSENKGARSAGFVHAGLRLLHLSLSLSLSPPGKVPDRPTWTVGASKRGHSLSRYMSFRMFLFVSNHISLRSTQSSVCSQLLLLPCAPFALSTVTTHVHQDISILSVPDMWGLSSE